MKSCPRLKIGFLFLFFVFCLVLFAPHYFPALAAAVAIHELGHMIAARICKIHLKELRLGLLGASLCPESSLFSYKKEIALCLCGPLASILSAALAVHIFGMSNDNIFVLSSLALGILNLLPVKDFDGGRTLYALCCLFMSALGAERVLKISSFLVLFCLWSFSLYLLLRVGSSLSLFVFCLSVFAKIFICVSR